MPDKESVGDPTTFVLAAAMTATSTTALTPTINLEMRFISIDTAKSSANK